MTRVRALLILVSLVVGLVIAAGARADTAIQVQPTIDDNEGFSGIAGCIAGADNLLVSIVVDESLSLRETDPSSLRVQGILTAVDSLVQLRDDSQGGGMVAESSPLNIEVSLATFARSYSVLEDWRSLTPAYADELRRTASDELPKRDSGDATDYRQALTGSQKQFDSRQRELKDPNACKLMLWFTDGALDVDEATAEATTELCQSGGIADSVRQDGITVVALALFTPGADVTSRQREQLQAVAEGRSDYGTCGTVPIPTDSARGEYLLADDPAALQRLFAEAGALVGGSTEVSQGSCPSADFCPDGTFTVPVDPGVAGARILISSSEDARYPIVTAPSGLRVTLAPGQSRAVDGAEVSATVREHLTVVSIDYDPYASKPAQWVVTPGVESGIDVFWNWRAHLAITSDSVTAGSKNRVQLQLIDQEGQPLNPLLYRRAQISIVAEGKALKAVVGKDGAVTASLPLGVDSLPSYVSIRASVSVVTDPTGIALGPIATTGRLTVDLPPAYPTVEPTEIDLGSLTGTGSRSAELTLTGSKLGQTQVCLSNSDVALPGDEPGSADVSTAQDCVSLAAGETKTMTVSLDVHEAAEGVASGKVSLRLTSAEGGPDLGLDIPTKLTMERPVNEKTRWLVLLALMALAVLLPILLIVGSNVVLGRLRVMPLSQLVVIPVDATPAGIRPSRGGTMIRPESIQNAAPNGNHSTASYHVPGTSITLRARKVFGLGNPVGMAESAVDGDVVMSLIAPGVGEVREQSEVPLGPLDATVLVLSAAGATEEQASGQLILLVPHSVDIGGISDRASQMAARPDWREILKTLAQPLTAASGGADSPGRGPATTRADSARSGPEDDRPQVPDFLSDDSLAPPGRPKSSGSDHRTSGSHPPSTIDDDYPPLPDFLKDD